MGDESVNTAPRCVLSFTAFEHWVSKAPHVYACLVNLLLPLLPYGAALTLEEVDLTARGLTQRCGELRARVEVRGQGVQRKRFLKLHDEFVKHQRELFAL